MAKVLVCLIGKRTTHNVQFIKYFKNEYDRLIFLTSTKWERSSYGPSSWIMDALRLNDKDVEKIIISRTNIHKMKSVLDNYSFSPDDTYYLNITGGNKLMSIFAANYFKRFNAKNFFLPENRGYLIEFGAENITIPLKNDLTLREYVRSHGLKIFESEREVRSFAESKRLMEQYIKFDGNINKVPDVKYATRYTRREDKEYYSGGWFEEYTYWLLKNNLKLPDSQIAMKVKIENQFTNNEYDVVFVKNDKIFVVECKAYFGKGNLKAKVEHDLYKLAALDDEFGMRSKGLYFTTFDIQGRAAHDNEVLLKRAKDLGVYIFQMKDFYHDIFVKKIKSWFKK
jgi:hypothetical protein